jgi:hypothetical protein
MKNKPKINQKEINEIKERRKQSILEAKNNIKETQERDKNKKSYRKVLNEIEAIRRNRCVYEYCRELSLFGKPDGIKQHCEDHKLDGEIDLVNKKCKSCGLYKVTSKTNYFCQFCNPDSVLRTKSKENIIRDLLLANNYKFIHNKQFANDCYDKYRPDFLFDCGTYFVVLEVDENKHSGYNKECEHIRMNNISMSLGLPTLFIRYNPDNKRYTDASKQQHLLYTINQNLNMELLLDPTPVYLFY